MLRGDDPSAGDQPDAKAVFDLDPRALLATARRLRDAGELPTGRKVGGNFDFFLGSADNPVDPPAGWKPAGLQAKIAANQGLSALNPEQQGSIVADNFDFRQDAREEEASSGYASDALRDALDVYIHFVKEISTLTPE